jgi:lipopolysaccharide transport system ATP-binding protein
MSDRGIAIRCDGIGKCFRRDDVDPYQGLRSKIQAVLTPWRRTRPPSGDSTVWALKDVSFEVPRGGVLGVLGGNGSGKSVLLKILARVTKASAGRSEVHGSVGSILHLGGMLLPDLTGRETIYQIGTILRLRRQAIDLCFDQIVSFSGVGAHLDSLVRGYSAGMELRLAFAVMVYLDADVLLVDEGLSVADQEFRRRCVERIREMAAQGRTIVLVSHEMDMMADLCDRALVLERGRLSMFGEARSVIAEYRRSVQSISNVIPAER